MSGGKRNTGLGVMLLTIIGMTGCAHPQWGMWGCGPCAPACNTCNTCETGCNTCETSCGDACGTCNTCEPACGGILPCGGQFMADVEFFLFGWACKKSNAIPETLPLGSTVRSHYQVMESNAEAADFILHRHDFVGQTAVLTSDGKDKVLEIAARMPSTPFPVVIERSENNSNPELDAMRRNLVARVVTDLGNQDGQQRTVVSTPYGPGYTGRRAEQMYYQHIYRGGNQNGNQNGGGGFGGGGFGGGGGGGFGGGF